MVEWVVVAVEMEMVMMVMKEIVVEETKMADTVVIKANAKMTRMKMMTMAIMVLVPPPVQVEI
jgi:hypothetical protein